MRYRRARICKDLFKDLSDKSKQLSEIFGSVHQAFIDLINAILRMRGEDTGMIP